MINTEIVKSRNNNYSVLGEGHFEANMQKES